MSESHTITQKPSSEDPRDAGAVDVELARNKLLEQMFGEAAAPTHLGRYVLLSKVGSGAMGVVYAAYDPELDRKVALKLLRPEREDHQGSEGRVRLLREAQALAKLSHHNVVAVHDVGTVEDQVWMAMEFVEGQTLTEWLAASPRTWREVLELLEAAGRGLSAAHRAGLLHRDFKPDNVMVGERGRVRVMDFGLARERPSEGDAKDLEAELASTTRHPALQALAEKVTQAGKLVGTPAYMSPEQLKAEDATAKSDQFAYCVTLWEALYGQRPFQGESLIDLATAILAGKFAASKGDQKVPGWLRKVAMRGLSQESSQRFESMDALLAALARGRAAARTRKVLAGVGVLAVLGAGAEGYRRYEYQQRVAACDARGASIEEVWNDEAREKLRAGLLATGVSYAPTVAEKVMPWIDKQAQAWRDAETDVCLKETVEMTWDGDHVDRARWCLEDRRVELQTLITQMAKADRTVVQNAVQAAAGLSLVISCTDEASLVGMGEPPPPELRERISAIRKDVLQARILEMAGKYDDGLEVARRAEQAARDLEWPPLIARAQAEQADLLSESGAYAEAEALGVAAYLEAARSGTWDVAAMAARHLVTAVGAKLKRHAEARLWAEHARVAIAHCGDPIGVREAALANNLGYSEREAGDYEAAMRLNGQASDFFEKALGPDHPHMATALEHLGLTLELTGNYERAESTLQRALEVRERVLGSGHPRIADSLNNLGLLNMRLGNFEKAEDKLARSLAVGRVAFGREHPHVAMAASNLGLLYQRMGDSARAKPLLEDALAVREAAYGPDHPDVAGTLDNLAKLHLSLGEYEQAKTYYVRTLDIVERTLSEDHPYAAYPLTGLAEIALAQNEPAKAVEQARRAVEIRETKGVAPQFLADSRFVLARALADRKQARALAQQVRDAYQEAGKARTEQLAEVEAWLAENQ